jgi:aminopeptidase N
MNYWGKHPSAYVNTIYRGGACALTRLRYDIGAVAFDAAMRGYVQANKGKIASTDDFLAAVRDAAPSYDLAAWEHLVGLN